MWTLGRIEEDHRAHLGEIFPDLRIGQQFGLDHGQMMAGLVDRAEDDQDVRFELVAQHHSTEAVCRSDSWHDCEARLRPDGVLVARSPAVAV